VRPAQLALPQWQMVVSRETDHSPRFRQKESPNSPCRCQPSWLMPCRNTVATGYHDPTCQPLRPIGIAGRRHCLWAAGSSDVGHGCCEQLPSASATGGGQVGLSAGGSPAIPARLNHHPQQLMEQRLVLLKLNGKHVPKQGPPEHSALAY